MTRGKLWAALLGAGAVGAVLGAAARGFLPPFVIDGPLWRAFFTGPPAAGLFAVVAASIAFYPAIRSTWIAREAAARDQWWKRAEWALGMAGSDEQNDREVAVDALSALIHTATETEGEMIFRTLTRLQTPPDQVLDTEGTTADNEERRNLPCRTDEPK